MYVNQCQITHILLVRSQSRYFTMEMLRLNIIGLFKSGIRMVIFFDIWKIRKLRGDSYTVLLYRIIQWYNDTGSVQDGPRTGRPPTIRTRNLKAKLQKRIVRNPLRSIRKMARDFEISKRTLGELFMTI